MRFNDYEEFIIGFKKLSNINLKLYKEEQMKRRLTTHIEKKGFSNFMSFLKCVEKDEKEFLELLDKITINVSEFYRNPQRWEVLETKILPYLIKNKEKIKCWSSACSTGEEPYTLTMILSKFYPLNEIKVTASDIDANAILKAKQGLYMTQSVKDVPPDVLQKHFKVNNNIYAVNEDIKKCVSFQQRNLLNDSFDTNHDLIICRNVIIYFTEDAKDMLYQKFANALKPGGILFVGATEQIMTPEKYGLTVHDSFFYRKK